MPKIEHRTSRLVIIAFVSAILACNLPYYYTSNDSSSIPPQAISTEDQAAWIPTPSTESAIEVEPGLAETLQLDQVHPEISYTIPLTIQIVTNDSATLFFELDKPVDGDLFYWPIDGGPDHAVLRHLSPTDTEHLITLDHLIPEVEYEAVVGIKETSGTYVTPGFNDGGWGSIHFRTLSEANIPFRVGVIGDSGFGTEVTYTLVEEMAGHDLDFVLHTGDVVYKVGEDPGPQASFIRKFYLPFAPLLKQLPVYPVVGNHDIDRETLQDDVPYYFHAFPPLLDLSIAPFGGIDRREWYAFSYGQAQFIMLNSQQFYTGDLLAEQTAWLTERLKDDRFATTVVVFHIAPYTSGLHTRDGKPIRSEWKPLFDDTGVDLVLSGHDHNYERLVFDGITYIVSGGGSGSLYSVKELLPQSKSFARRSHFLVLGFFPDKIELFAIGLGGDVFDEAVIPLE